MITNPINQSHDRHGMAVGEVRYGIYSELISMKAATQIAIYYQEWLKTHKSPCETFVDKRTKEITANLVFVPVVLLNRLLREYEKEESSKLTESNHDGQ